MVGDPQPPAASFRATVVAGIVAWAVMEPSGIAWAAKGLVANGGAADTVTLFDAATGSAITIEYPFFKRPRWVAITADGRFAGVTNGAGETITWLDLRDRGAPVVLGKTFVDANPKGIAIKGSVAVVALDNPAAGSMDSVKVIAVGGLPHIPRDADITSLDLGADANPEGVAITPDGRFGVITRAGVKKLAYVDLTGPSPALLAAGTKVGRGAFGITVTPDGTRALVTSKTGGTLSIIDLTGLPVVPGPAKVTTFAVGDSPGAVAVTPDGDSAIIAEAGSSDAARIVDLVALTSTTVSLATPAAADPDPFGVAIMAGPDGPQAVIADTAAGTVSVVDLASRTVVRTIAAGPGPQGVAMLPVKAPKATLSVAPTSGSVPLVVTFDGTRSTGPRRRGRLVHVHVRRRHVGDRARPDRHPCLYGDREVHRQPGGHGRRRRAVPRGPQEREGGAQPAAKASLKVNATTGKFPFLVTLDASVDRFRRHHCLLHVHVR